MSLNLLMIPNLGIPKQIACYFSPRGYVCCLLAGIAASKIYVDAVLYSDHGEEVSE